MASTVELVLQTLIHAVPCVTSNGKLEKKKKKGGLASDKFNENDAITT